MQINTILTKFKLADFNMVLRFRYFVFILIGFGHVKTKVKTEFKQYIRTDYE